MLNIIAKLIQPVSNKDIKELLKIETWKYYSKIIFKCVNNIVVPIFNESCDEKRGLWVSWTMHGTHWKHHNHTKLLKVKCASKKKKKKGQT